jgi:hypothetical protein
MKAIDLRNAEITRVGSRKDRSISFGVNTPELTGEQAAAFLQLHGTNVRMLIQPQDIESEDTIEVEAELDIKTPAQRLRGVIFVHYKKQTEGQQNPVSFATFYASQMDRIIEGYKKKHLD